MPRQAADLIPVVQRSYDLCAGLCEQVTRFPRAQRGLLGRAILDDGLQLLTLLTVANRRERKREGLAEASGRLDALRVGLRLSNRMGWLSNGGYERLTFVADEVGRMLGGWLKYEARQGELPLEAAARGGGSPEGSGAGERGESAAPSSEAAPARAADPGPAHPGAATARRRVGGVRYTMTSPTIDRYLRVKLEHPEAVVFIAVGAFFQTFFEDALFCNRTVRLALRDMAADSEPEKIPACGFPRGRLEKFAGLLQQAGRAVHAE